VDEVIKYPFHFKQSGNQMPENNQIIDILSDLGLDAEVLDKEFTDLSTGQRQRVGIALCILLDKPVLLLDEPTSALDEASKEKAAHHLLSDPARTVLSTSHDPFWIEKCSRIIDLNSVPDKTGS
jgi:ABC-type lipoprotein export system ATPase subunit